MNLFTVETTNPAIKLIIEVAPQGSIAKTAFYAISQFNIANGTCLQMTDITNGAQEVPQVQQLPRLAVVLHLHS